MKKVFLDTNVFIDYPLTKLLLSNIRYSHTYEEIDT